jgi:ADP-ribose pyrophosphatase YjhB (NUDIX family)
MFTKNAHCSYCGVRFTAEPWPRICGGCGVISYVNPLPVGVVVLPVDGGVLCVRRGITPGKGLLALPGGFLELHESWQEGAARELFEETGIRIDPGEITLLDVHSVAREGLVLIFGAARPRRAIDLPAFVPCEEVTERMVLHEAAELAFSTHTDVLRAFLSRR